LLPSFKVVKITEEKTNIHTVEVKMVSVKIYVKMEWFHFYNLLVSFVREKWLQKKYPHPFQKLKMKIAFTFEVFTFQRNVFVNPQNIRN